MQHSGCWWFVVVLNIRTFLHRSQMPFILWCMRCFDTEADYHSCCVQMATQDLRVLQCLGDKSKVLQFWNRKLYTINQFLSGRPEQDSFGCIGFCNNFARMMKTWIPMTLKNHKRLRRSQRWLSRQQPRLQNRGLTVAENAACCCSAVISQDSFELLMINRNTTMAIAGFHLIWDHSGIFLCIGCFDTEARKICCGGCD